MNHEATVKLAKKADPANLVRVPSKLTASPVPAGIALKEGASLRYYYFHIVNSDVKWKYRCRQRESGSAELLINYIVKPTHSNDSVDPPRPRHDLHPRRNPPTYRRENHNLQKGLPPCENWTVQVSPGQDFLGSSCSWRERLDRISTAAFQSLADISRLPA